SKGNHDGGVLRAKVAWHAERRTLEKSMRQVDTDRTRVSSQRQLPTDHDYAGGQRCSIREYQSDQPSSRAASTFARNTPPPREEGIKKKKKEGRGLTGHFISDLIVSFTVGSVDWLHLLHIFSRDFYELGLQILETCSVAGQWRDPRRVGR